MRKYARNMSDRMSVGRAHSKKVFFCIYVFFFTCAGSGNFAWPGAEKELKHSRHSSQAVWLSSAVFDLVWLVVLTILKNISQWEGLSNHQPPKWNMENKKCSKPPSSCHSPYISKPCQPFLDRWFRMKGVASYKSILIHIHPYSSIFYLPQDDCINT